MNSCSRHAAALSIAVGLVVVAGCTSNPSGSAPGSTGAPAAAPSPRGTAPSIPPEPMTDEITPLVVSSLSPPIPVKGTDDKVHVSYELVVTNATPRPANLREVETLVGDRVMATVDAEELAERTMLLGPMLLEPLAAKVLPAGGAAILVLDDVYPTRGDVPDRFRHRIRATFDPPAPGSHPFASQYPDEADDVTPEIALGVGEPVVLGPPLRGANWLAANACCTLSPHRGAILPMSGRLNASERYAIDWIRVNETMASGSSSAPEGMMPTFEGDPMQNDAYLAYDQDLLAVADGTVVAVSDGMSDSTPQQLPEGLTVHELGGNHLIVDIGDGFFAFYAHIIPGSFTVRQGDRVQKGDVVGKLGNSGNSSEAHLHFHLMRGTAPLGATNWPYVYEQLEVRGTLTEAGIMTEPTPGARRDVLPLSFNVITFPDS